MKQLWMTGMVALMAVAGTGCGKKSAITVGSKHFTEQKILGEMVCQLIEDRTDLPVRRRLGLQGTRVAFAALQEGDIDIYPEYTGTGLINILGASYDASVSREDIWQQVKQAFSDRWDLQWFAPLGFANTYAYAMRADHARELGITTISDLAPHADALTAGFDHEYTTRPEFERFEELYGFSLTNMKRLDPDLTYRALKDEKVDVIDAFSTDGRIQAYTLELLDDDRGLFPPYDACLVVRKDTLARHPKLKALLQTLEGRITPEVMQRMNFAVSEHMQAPADVAKNFLRQEGLID